MARTVHLVRHGHHAILNRRLCGRMPNVALDEWGCRQMSHLAEAMHPEPIAIQTSPQQRAQQSAGILASYFGLKMTVVPAMDEIDMGDWTSLSFAELERDPRWTEWNTHRSSSSPPNGESMITLQRRVVGHIEHLRETPGHGSIVIVSHAEPIRSALLHYAGIPLDDFLSVEIAPASVSTLSLERTHVNIAKINQQVPA